MQKIAFLSLIFTLWLAACTPQQPALPAVATNTPVPTFTPTPEIVVMPVDPAAATTARAAETEVAAANQPTAVVEAPPEAQPAAEQPTPTEAAPVPTDPPATEPVVILAQTMNVRGGPGTSYAIIGAGNTGQQFTVTGKNPQGDWWQINYNGQTGWVYGPLVTAQNTGSVAIAANIPQLPPTATPRPAQPTPVPQQPTNTPVPAAPTVPAAPPPTPVPQTPFLLLEGVERCDPNPGQTYFSGFTRARDNSLINGVCIHIGFFGPRTTKCSGCDGVGDGNWGFSPFGGPATPGTTVEIFVIQCPVNLPAGGQSSDFADLTPQSPKWVKTITDSQQCTGITFVRN